MLKAGHYCVRFRLAGADADGEPAGALTWFHIGYHLLSPWRSTFQLLFAGAAPPGEPAPDDNRVYVEVWGLTLHHPCRVGPPGWAGGLGRRLRPGIGPLAGGRGRRQG